MANFTFKKVPRATGLAGVGERNCTYVKLNKLRCGEIVSAGAFEKFHGVKVRLCIKDEKEHCGWKWITLSKFLVDDEDARVWLKDVHPAIVNRYTLHFFED